MCTQTRQCDRRVSYYEVVDDLLIVDMSDTQHPTPNGEIHRKPLLLVRVQSWSNESNSYYGRDGAKFEARPQRRVKQCDYLFSSGLYCMISVLASSNEER